MITLAHLRGHKIGATRGHELPEVTLDPKGAQADHSAISAWRTDWNQLIWLNSVGWTHPLLFFGQRIVSGFFGNILFFVAHSIPLGCYVVFHGQAYSFVNIVWVVFLEVPGRISMKDTSGIASLSITIALLVQILFIFQSFDNTSRMSQVFVITLLCTVRALRWASLISQSYERWPSTALCVPTNLGNIWYSKEDIQNG